jgi:hypothetical protein
MSKRCLISQLLFSHALKAPEKKKKKRRRSRRRGRKKRKRRRARNSCGETGNPSAGAKWMSRKTGWSRRIFFLYLSFSNRSFYCIAIVLQRHEAPV